MARLLVPGPLRLTLLLLLLFLPSLLLLRTITVLILFFFGFSLRFFNFMLPFLLGIKLCLGFLLLLLGFLKLGFKLFLLPDVFFYFVWRGWLPILEALVFFKFLLFLLACFAILVTNTLCLFYSFVSYSLPHKWFVLSLEFCIRAAISALFCSLISSIFRRDISSIT